MAGERYRQTVAWPPARIILHCWRLPKPARRVAKGHSDA
jgi:hypothetical protein